MSYQSPLHIIKKIADQDFQINETNLIRLRKQLLADLNLSGNTTIAVKDKFYSKDEIIKTFDVLLSSPDLDLHEFIYNNKNLLAFLENEELNYTSANFYKIAVPESIREKLSPLIERRFILQLKKNISKRNFVYARESVLYVNQLKEDRKDINYEEIHKSIVALANFNNEITASIKRNDTDRSAKDSVKGDYFKYLGDIKVAAFLNALPPNFNDVIDTFVMSAINLMFYYHKQASYDKKLVSRISYMLMDVRLCDENNYDMIRHNHKIYSKTGGGGSKTNYAGVIFFIIIIIVRIISASSSSSSYDNSYQYNADNYSSNQFVPLPETSQTYLDSLTKLASDSSYYVPGKGKEQMPSLPHMNNYIQKTLKYPQAAIDNGTEGTVHVAFIVEADGKISHVKALDSIGNGCEKEAVRVVKSMPRWKPGKKDGKPVRIQFNLPIKFKLN